MKYKIFLDTSYLLPLFGVDIELTKDDEKKLLTIIENFNPSINSLSLLEIKWKILHFSKKNKLLLERYHNVLQFVTLSGKFKIVHFYDFRIDHIATKLYEFHNDYIDCSILAAALENADILLTEDTKIKQLGQIIKERNFLSIVNKARFEIKSISELPL